MRRLLGSVLPALLSAVLVAAALGGCGDDTSGDATASDPTDATSTAGSPASTPASIPATTPPIDPGQGDGSVDFEVVELITVTNADGTVSGVAVPLTDDAAVQAFLGQFDSDEMVTRVQDAVATAEVGDGQALYGAVVSVGCDSPTEVAVTDTGAGLSITALKVPHPQEECFAAMTTVALVVAPASFASPAA
jgi:hypothetical protein